MTPAWARLCLALALALALAGCARAERELPDNAADTSLKPSPCACIEIEGYEGGGFEWNAG